MTDAKINLCSANDFDIMSLCSGETFLTDGDAKVAQEFIDRLSRYMNGVIQVLNIHAEASAIFPNNTDNGQSKERIFGEIVRLHVPASCNIFQGGYLFDLNGNESNQIDLIVADSNSLKYDLHNKSGDGKAFSCIDGTISALSIKSYLSKRDLFDALENIASIPQGTALNPDNSDPHIRMDGMSDGLLKVIVAMDGVSHQTAEQHLIEFFSTHPDIPVNRRPNYIWVVGKYCWVKVREPMEDDKGTLWQAGTLLLRTLEPDMYALCEILLTIEKLNRLHRHIFYNYTPIFSKLSPKKDAILILLCHILGSAISRVFRQHGHRGSVLTRALARRRRMVAMDVGTWRSGRGGAAWLEALG